MFPKHRINAFSYLKLSSSALVSDTKVACEQLVALSGSPNAQFFERRAQQFMEAIMLTIAERDGVVTPPALYDVISLAAKPSDRWLDFAFLMSESRFPIARQIEEEIAEGHSNSASSAFQGILGELFKAVACLSDPALMESLSPPYDFDFEQLVTSDQRYNVYLCPPAEFVEAWAPMIKALLTCAMIYKSRAPSAPRQLWILDEAGNLSKFPLAVKLYTIGAGMGIRPWCIFQSVEQIQNLGPSAKPILLSSAATRQFFGIRDFDTAQTVSKMIGTQTLHYDDTARQAEATLAKRRAAFGMMNGQDPMMAAIEMRHHAQAETRQSKQARQLRTPAEVLQTPEAMQFIFADKVGAPIYCEKRAYYQQRFMSGRFFPNPYHPPTDRVRVKTMLGHRWRHVIDEPIPRQFADYPQYSHGQFSRLSQPRRKGD